jgi:hypothetical protein
MSAQYEESAWVQLTFDRLIDIGSLDGAQITVDDGPLSGTRWAGTGAAVLIDPLTVRVELNAVEPSSSPEVLLSATAANGIVAVDDGAAWAGVTNYPIDA